MENVVTPLNWRSKIQLSEIDSIDLDYILKDEYVALPETQYPFKLDISVIVICIKGTLNGLLNLKEYNVTGPGILIIMPDQILQNKGTSDDFEGRFITMSKQFSNTLIIDAYDRFPLFRSISDHPWLPLNPDELDLALDYYNMFLKTVRMKDNSNRAEMIRHLSRAFFYALNHKFQNLDLESKKSKQELLTERFFHLVKEKYREQRGLDYYADELFLTPKYLSKVVKDTSGKSASDWINDFVILEAKALLKSTNMTIQQISHSLNFPSQSFFGKYFKRYSGESPKTYRES
ncbi:AraC family transcriptional regulator [Mangrovibacterium diazotrophicum]|nr:helix-turn-helix domain-containing protein [Mangrovibacterium diazotrophicum]